MNWTIASSLLLLGTVVSGQGDDLLQLGPLQIQTNRAVVVTIQAPLAANCRVEVSPDLTEWEGLMTFLSAASNRVTDSSAPYEVNRFYRARTVETNAMTGDHLATADGEVTIHPVEHASFVLGWKGKTIYSDPVGAASLFKGLPQADLVLVTHGHGDHYSASTIAAIKGSNAVILAPRAVYNMLPTALKQSAIVLTNGASTNLLDVTVEAVPAYNLTATYHPKGEGNGYVLNLGGKRIYVSGDTEDTPELRSLPDIDVAFVCMNLPFTMSVDKAASAVLEMGPKVVYVYHYRGYGTADLSRFQTLVSANPGIEVRMRKWY